MRDAELPCRKTVNKSLLLLFFIIILQAVLPKKKRKKKPTVAFITPSWVAIACSQTLYFHFFTSKFVWVASHLNEYFILHRSLIRPWKGLRLYWKASGNMSVNTAERTFVKTDTLNGNYHLCHLSIQQSEEPLGLSDIFVMRHTRDESLLRELSSRCREGASVRTALPRSYQVIIFSYPHKTRLD